MPALKRLLQVPAFAVCVLSSTVVFAADGLATVQPVAVVSSLEETPEVPSLQEEIDFGALFTPEPINRSCTATSQCTPVGGVPQSCVGVTTCSSAATWVTCDHQITYCTCNPSGVPNCFDSAGFCNCWNSNHNTFACRQIYCIEP